MQRETRPIHPKSTFACASHSRQRPAFARAQDELRARTRAFSASTTLDTQTTSFIRLFHSIWTGSSERAFNVRLLCWVRMLEHDDLLRLDFQEAFQSMLAGLDSVALLAEAGLPKHHAVFSEGLRRLLIASCLRRWPYPIARACWSRSSPPPAMSTASSSCRSLSLNASAFCSLRLPPAVGPGRPLACRAICARRFA